MKIYYYLTFAMIASLLTSINAFSQDIQIATIEWHINSATVSGQISVSYENTRIVSSPEQIVWYDQNGAIKKTLSVVKVDREWNDVSVDGYVMFFAKSGNNTATIYFSRSNGVTQISIKNIESAESPTYDLNVVRVNSL